MSRTLLLCELHAHTTWSDGSLSVRELVDLYGSHGFDVLAVTDHLVRTGDTMRAIEPARYHAYRFELVREAERARREFGLLVIPGLELSDNREDADRSAHALALGLRTHLSLDDGFVEALRAARAEGAAIVAAHPYGPQDRTPLRATRRFACEHPAFSELVDRWELFNRREVFSWVAAAGLPSIATGDVHREEQISSWKTLLPCDKDEESVLAYLRSAGRAYLMPFDGARSERLPVAA